MQPTPQADGPSWTDVLDALELQLTALAAEVDSGARTAFPVIPVFDDVDALIAELHEPLPAALRERAVDLQAEMDRLTRLLEEQMALVQGQLGHIASSHVAEPRFLDVRC